jgi:tetratricopeptide (TPR) repeat protein
VGYNRGVGTDEPRPSSLPSTSARAFVGRVAELSELGRGLDESLAGRGRLYLLSGEPGIGKTRLSDELSAIALEKSVPVLWGRCWEAGGAPAYWPWLDVLAALGAMLDDAALSEALGDGAALVSDLVPQIRARRSALSAVLGGADEARFRLFRAVSAFVRRAAAPRGVVIVLEDLHAADESSLLLLHFLARELRGMRAFVLGTFRDVEARLSVEVGEALGRLSREGTTLSLARLGPDDAERFVRERVGPLEPAVVAQLLRRTQGNPLFLEEMARLVGTNRELPPEALPLGVREVIRQRLVRVSPATRGLLEVAAVAGDEMEPGFVADAAGEPPDTVARAFGEATRAGVLVSRERQRFRFSHALVREVLDRDLSRERRKELHGGVARALERRAAFDANPPLSELSHHWLEGPSSGLARAVDYAVRAAERAVALSAFEDAVALLERVRTAVEEQDVSPRLKAEVRIALGRTHIRRGAGAVGQALCQEAAEIARTLGDGELLALAALAYGLEITAALVNPSLIRLLEEALAALPEADSALRVQITARLAAALQPHPAPAYPIRLAAEAIASARRIGDAGTLLGALYTGMSAMMDIVDPRERLPLNLEAESLATAARDSERLLRTQARLVFDYMELGDFLAADSRIDAFARIASETGAERYLWRVPLFRSMRAMIHGRFSDSEAFCEEARALALAASDPQLDRCYVFHREGLLRAWERHADMVAGETEARRMRLALYSGPHWQNGGSAFTYSRLEDREKTRFHLDLLPPEDWPLAHNPPAFMHLGEPLALVGNERFVRVVYDLLRPARERCLSWGWTCFLWDGTATRVLGLLAERLGERDEASAYFEDAIRALERLDAKPYLARTRYEYGRALLQRDEASSHDRALFLLDEARHSAEALGMAGLVRLAENRLADAPSASRARGSDAPLAGSVPNRQTFSTKTDSGVPAPFALTAGLPFAFVPEGEYWSVTHEGETFRLRDSLGIQYLARLFASPDQAIHVLELSGGKSSGEGEVIDGGDAGELLDDDAKESYKRRLGDLRKELAEAESFADKARATRAHEEIEFLAAELSRAVGLGGRARRAGGAAERARSAVQRRIRNALERVREASPTLARLLGRTVKTGNFCSFSPGNAARH